MMKYDLIAFDYDGTLVDTIAFHTVTISSIVRACGTPMDDAAVRQHLGGTLVHIFGQILPREKVAGAIEKLRHLYEDIPPRYWDYITVVEGTEATLSALKARGVRLALITNSHYRLIAQSLEHFNLGRFFDLVLGDDEICRNKLERFDKMTAFFQVPPERILYVGDSATDVRDAHAKGFDAAILDTDASWFHQIRPQPAETLGADYLITAMNALLDF